LFVEHVSSEGNLTIIRGEQARYLAKVLRIRLGENIILFDGSGAEYLGINERVLRNDVQIRILEKYDPPAESPLDLVLFQGIPKADKMDIIVKGTTELGVSSITPFFSSRTVPRWKGETLNRKVVHWKRIALEATRQSGRTKVPCVGKPVTFDEMIRKVEQISDGFLKLVLWEDERERKIKDLFKKSSSVSGICFFVGPEGGFSPGEVNLLKNIGCIPVHLGRRILRTETTALTLMSIIQYEWGDLS